MLKWKKIENFTVQWSTHKLLFHEKSFEFLKIHLNHFDHFDSSSVKRILYELFESIFVELLHRVATERLNDIKQK